MGIRISAWGVRYGGEWVGGWRNCVPSLQERARVDGLELEERDMLAFAFSFGFLRGAQCSGTPRSSSPAERVEAGLKTYTHCGGVGVGFGPFE